MAEKIAKKAAFICSRDTLDGAYPALVLAINAARQGMNTKVFYTFMGLNLVQKGGMDKAKFIPSGIMGAIPGVCNMATSIMKGKIDKANVPCLPDLVEMAQLEGVQLVACKMTVDMMEVSEDRFVEDVIVWTAEDFIKYAQDCDICLFT